MGAMKGRTAARVAWSLFALNAALTASSLALIALAGSIPPGFGRRDLEILDNLSFLLIPYVGALIASRRADNLLGWGLLAATLVGAVGELSGWYALHAVVIDPGSLPVGRLAAWFTNVAWIVPIGCLPLLFLLFPDGRLPSPGWKWLAGAVAVPIILITGPVALALWRAPAETLLLDSDSISVGGLAEASFLAALALLLLFALVSALSLFVRFRRADGIQRQQIKWLAFAGLLLSLDGIVTTFVFPEATLWTSIADTLAFATIPVAIGIAILKYRLYDIDRIINRTLVYGALTAILGAAYALIVTVAGAILQGSEIVTAGGTLAVAALFQPLRRRIQGFIDRRFYRRKYDAARTVDDFSSRLRNEVDLGDATLPAGRGAGDDAATARLALAKRLACLAGYELRTAAR